MLRLGGTNDPLCKDPSLLPRQEGAGTGWNKASENTAQVAPGARAYGAGNTAHVALPDSRGCSS